MKDLDEVLPNRNTFGDNLFNQNDLYITSSPTAAPSSPCEDSPFRFKVEIDGQKKSRDCGWVATRATASRCKLTGVKEQCPSTCNKCPKCVDSILRYKFEYNGKKITRDCTWVANKSTNIRCAISGMEHTCRNTCGTC
jgi:hypothetical protein